MSQVTGNLTANLTRSKLLIDGVDGILNVRNDFGDTHCTIAKSMMAGNHRIVGQSGLVSVLVAKDAKIDLPIFAATSCGSAATNLDRDELDDLNVTYNSTEGIRRNWRSLYTALPQNDFEARFALHERPDQIIADHKRSPGLDLISVAGRVEYIQMDQ